MQRRVANGLALVAAHNLGADDAMVCLVEQEVGHAIPYLALALMVHGIVE